MSWLSFLASDQNSLAGYQQQANIVSSVAPELGVVWLQVLADQTGLDSLHLIGGLLFPPHK